jgi:biotin transporter BioY
MNLRCLIQIFIAQTYDFLSNVREFVQAGVTSKPFCNCLSTLLYTRKEGYIARNLYLVRGLIGNNCLASELEEKSRADFLILLLCT